MITFGWILGILGIVLIIPCCLGLILIGYVYSRVDRRVNNLLTALSVKHTTKLRVKFIWRMETIVISTGDKNEIDTVRKYVRNRTYRTIGWLYSFIFSWSLKFTMTVIHCNEWHLLLNLKFITFKFSEVSTISKRFYLGRIKKIQNQRIF